MRNNSAILRLSLIFLVLLSVCMITTVDTVSAYPAAPQLDYPWNGMNVGGTVIPFRWHAVEGAYDYYLQVATDAGFTNVVFGSWIGNYIGVDLSGFPDNGQIYYWRVAAYDGEVGPFSSTWYFVNGPSAPPEIPTLSSPANGANVAGTTIEFRWNPAARASDYRLQVATDAGFTSTVFDQWIGNYIGINLSGFPDNGQTFYWRVTARNVLGQSPSSAAWSFVNGTPPPPPPSTCTSTYGSGIGVLGDYKDHIDTCQDSGSGTYYLYDLSRRVNQTGHNHNGQMGADEEIETYHYGEQEAMTDPDNVWDAPDQRSGVDAHVYAARVYDYLLDSSKGWSLNSYDGAGSSMRSVVEVSTDPFGDPCADNAFWYIDRVSYCVSGSYLPFSGALDVVAHEWGHAVTEMVGANFVNQPQPRALNEAFSDWLGAAVESYYGEPESNVWTSGEGISIIRSLSNPPDHSVYCDGQWIPQPDHMSGYTTCTNPLREAYLNMGIPNKMFYLLSRGDTHYGITVQGIGIERAIQIAYRANVERWPNNATFQDALDGMVYIAQRYFGTNEVYQVRNAWAAVGVGTIPVIVVNASTGGTVSGGGSYEWGSTATVTAIPDPGYAFVNWTEDGVEVSTSTTYTFTVDGDRNLVANFTPIPQISITPTSYDFGSFYVGTPSPYKTFTVTNTGMAALTIQSVSITGDDPVHFSYIDMCTGDILSPSDSCTIDVQFLPLSVGIKNATLSIQSDDPNTPVVDVSLRGTGLNNPPTANAGGPYTATEGQSITLDASGSSDLDGTITLYEWDIDNDGIYDYSSTLPTQSHIYAQQGTYTIKLRVTDNLGATDEATTTATISDTSPTADFTATPTSGTAPLTVNFTNNSTGYDQPLTYEWDFDNNGTIDSTAQNPSYTYNTAGTYTVKLTVTDSDGSTNSLTRTDYITVTPPGPLTYTLTVNIAGAGTGAVTSNPAGIDCGADCTEGYEEGTVVTLTAIPDTGSIFIGWSGGGCSGIDECVVTMNADITVTATFDICSNQPVKIIGRGYYSTLQEAYDVAVDGDIIQVQAVRLMENLNLNRDITVTLDGGYNCDFTTKTGKTRLKGMIVSGGVVTVRDFIMEK